MKHTHYLLPILTGALLASCGTTPVTTPQAYSAGSSLQAQGGTTEEPTMKSAAASGRIGAWAKGRIGAWAKGLDSSTVASGVPNTFSENAAAWKLIKLPEAQAMAPNLGRGVVVAVIDTGLDVSHPVFAGHLTAPESWYDFVGQDTDPSDVSSSGGDLYGHGTAVASLVLQVAPEARILPIRVLNATGGGTVKNLAAGVDWAVKQGAQVINLSVASGVDGELSLALERAAAQGIYITLAAGNEGFQQVAYPARNTTKEDSMLGRYGVNAGAVSPDMALADWSNYGNTLELAAPGVDLATAVPNGEYAVVNGTSFAAPVLSGTLALALGESYSPTLKGQLALMMNTTATDITPANRGLTRGKSNILGNGVVNAWLFMKKVLR
ncbi:hypothetical protein GCM10010840_24200 [Deinococcus aerolatus]|uniref:Peptidase S8/S53 domain-containing protein n=1 Tax=Deinococcus aerolatus TaxID=522487 RepID=A0ABQ2GBZ8_9DEIO|nr:S8 family serine peptidase [Deinococcus aerolatus]GGL85457.1 hypothetical protein GCM10010840_24200 [Deinococcus aerolatus]